MRNPFLICVLLLGLMAGCTFTVSGGGDGDGDGATEFYWDDGTISEGWIWYTSGNYWCVQFNEEKTTGLPGTVTRLGAYTMPNWPDSTFQGADLHVFSDSGGQPGNDLDSVFIDGSGWQWADIDVEVDSGVFWISWQQIGNYPACDALGFDEDSTGHSWGWEGGWIDWGDAMLRCYWKGASGS
jgi:hypothetical protein